MTSTNAHQTVRTRVLLGPIVMIGFGSIGRGTLPFIDRHIEFDRTRAVIVDPNDHDRQILERVRREVPADGRHPRELPRPAADAADRRRGPGFLHQPVGRHVVGRHHAAVPSTRRAVRRHRRRAVAGLLLRQGNGQRHTHQPRVALDGPRRTATVAGRHHRGLVLRRQPGNGVVVREGSAGDTRRRPRHRRRRAGRRRQRRMGRLHARASGSRGIHIAERDTQRARSPKPIDVFWNTWSVDGFICEGLQPAELGWGTHESWMPDNARRSTTRRRPASSSNSRAPRPACAPGARRTASSTGSS